MRRIGLGMPEGWKESEMSKPSVKAANSSNKDKGCALRDPGFCPSTMTGASVKASLPGVAEGRRQGLRWPAPRVAGRSRLNHAGGIPARGSGLKWCVRRGFLVGCHVRSVSAR